MPIPSPPAVHSPATSSPNEWSRDDESRTPRHWAPAGRDPLGTHPAPRRRDGLDDLRPRADRGGLPRRPLPQPPRRSEELHRGAGPDPAADDRGHPPRLPRGRRRHHRDLHLQRQRRLRWPSSACRSTSSRSTRPPPRSPAAPPTTITRRNPDKPRFVAGSIGPTNKTALDGHPRRGPGPPRRDLRRVGRQLHRADPRPGRRRRRHPAARDRHSTPWSSRRACSPSTSTSRSTASACR